MNILILANKPPYPPLDGGAIATLQLIKSLVMAGNSVTVFYLNTTKHRMNPTFIPKDISSGANFHATGIDTRIKLIPAVASLSGGSIPYIYRRFYSKPAAEQIRETAGKTNADIIIFEGLAMTVYYRDLSSLPLRLIFRPHNIESLIWKRLAKRTVSPFHRAYYHILSKQIEKYESRIINHFENLWPLSQNDASQFMLWNFNGKINVIPVGISAGQYQKAIKSRNKNAILFLGALDWKPNVQGLQWFTGKVWPGIRNDLPGAVLHVAGRNPASGLKKTAGLPDVTFHGEIEDKISFLHSGQIFIVPLFAGSGIRIKILEAMAAGCVVVSTSTGAEGLPVIHNEHILLADDPDSFKKAIIRFMKDENLVNRIRENALHLIRNKFDTLGTEQLIGKVLENL